MSKGRNGLSCQQAATCKGEITLTVTDQVADGLAK